MFVWELRACLRVCVCGRGVIGVLCTVCVAVTVRGCVCLFLRLFVRICTCFWFIVCVCGLHD